MTTPNEYTLVEKPILDALTGLYGYRYLLGNRIGSHNSPGQVVATIIGQTDTV